MKWIAIGGLLALIPLLTALFRSQPKYLVHACFAMGALVFVLEPFLAFSPISWSWPGAVKGIQLSILDTIAISMIFATKSVRFPLGIKVGLLIYLTALAISTFNASPMMASVFYVWQFLRAVLVFIAVARASAMIKGAPIALVAGLGSAMIVEAVLATRQYIGGETQPGGTLGHRNILGLTSHFAVMPLFALLLAGRRNLLAALVVLAGLVIALVGGSRATIGLYAIGLVITAVLSIRHKMTGRKAGFAVAAVVALALSAPAMMWALERRGESALQSSDEERRALTEAARMIIADYPLGVGANQYLVVANVGGYSDRAGVPWNYANRSAPVHNSYYLVAAELSIVGLVGFITMLASMLFLGLRSMGRLIADERSELFIGLLAALVVVCAHLAFEWLFVTVYIHYLLAMNLGAMSGIAATLRQRSRRGARAPGAAASASGLAAQPS